MHLKSSSPRDDSTSPEVLSVIPAELADEMGGLLVAVEGHDPHALLRAVVPGAAVAELLSGGAPPRQQIVLAVPHVVSLAAAGGRGRFRPAGEAGARPSREPRARPAGNGGGTDLVETAGREAGPAAEGGGAAVKGGPGAEGGAAVERRPAPEGGRPGAEEGLLRGGPAKVKPGAAEGVEGGVLAPEPLGDGDADEERGAQQQPHLAVNVVVR